LFLFVFWSLESSKSVSSAHQHKEKLRKKLFVGGGRGEGGREKLCGRRQRETEEQTSVRAVGRQQRKAEEQTASESNGKVVQKSRGTVRQ
jgi:hypothetical protein